jgi:hypothetical protein
MSHGDKSGLYRAWSNIFQLIEHTVCSELCEHIRTDVVMQHGDIPHEHARMLSPGDGMKVSEGFIIALCIDDYVDDVVVTVFEHQH